MQPACCERRNDLQPHIPRKAHIIYTEGLQRFLSAAMASHGTRHTSQLGAQKTPGPEHPDRSASPHTLAHMTRLRARWQDKNKFYNTEKVLQRSRAVWCSTVAALQLAAAILVYIFVVAICGGFDADLRYDFALLPLYGVRLVTYISQNIFL